MEQNKIKKALEMIKVDRKWKWYVPNREQLSMSIDQFVEFERQRIMEFNNEEIRNTKYREHYNGCSEEQRKQILLFLPKKTL